MAAINTDIREVIWTGDKLKVKVASGCHRKYTLMDYLAGLQKNIEKAEKDLVKVANWTGTDTAVRVDEWNNAIPKFTQTMKN